MLRDWSDEWKNARLALELRDDELFQGETLSVVVRAAMTLDTTPSTGAADTAGTPQSEASLSTEEVHTLALEQLEARWRRHCDGALVDLKVVEPAPSKRDKSMHAAMQLQQQQPRTTLFHQESRLVVLPLRREDATAVGTTSLRVTLRLRCECTLRVRAEFWQRPLSLIARVAPSASQDDDVDATQVQPLAAMLLSEAYTRNHIFSLLREQTTEPPNLTRRVEHKLRIVKPLALKMETKFVSGSRVVIVARATNTHESLGMRVLDLQLHVDPFVGQAGVSEGANTKGAEYRVVKNRADDFPVELLPQEQYNFVFIVEPVGGTVAGGGGGTSATPSSSSQHDSQQSLVTLSWEAITDDSNESSASLLQPITEHHTILWSPHPARFPLPTNGPAAMELLEFLPKPPPQFALTNASTKPADSTKAVSVVRRGDRSCPLSVTFAPLRVSSTDAPTEPRVGVVETLCVVVANKSQDSTEFDLSLVIPPPQSSRRSWVNFEASHHLGRLRAGTIIRKSLRLVFLQHGPADLNGLLLFDHITRTWFLPPSPSASTAWEVFVHP